MAYNSFNKILFLSSIENIGKIFSPNEIPFYNFDVSSSCEELAFEICSSNTKQQFCISLKQTENNLLLESLEQLVLCLTHPYYYKENLQHVLLVQNRSELHINLTDYLQLHGFTFYWLELKEQQPDSVWVLNQPAEIMHLQKEYEKKIIEQQFVNKWILILDLLPVNDMLHIREGLHNTENKLKQNSPLLENLVSENKKLQQENNFLRQKTTYLNRELDHYKVFNQQLKEQDESEKILRFYHKEYEQLPLWYKRLGHIIKVITGKRKLSSLIKKSKV